MAINRIPITLTDDDGSQTTGTVWNNANRTTLIDTLDGRWSVYTITTTGTANDLSITTSGLECDVLNCNNASALTITGIAAPASPAKPGKPLRIVSIGAGSVTLANTPTASAAANEIITGSGQNITLTSLVGTAYLHYDSVSAMWRVLFHQQGRPIAYTPTIAAQTGTFTTVSATGRYTLTKRWCQLQIAITITSIGTAAGYFTATLPFTAASEAYTGSGINVSNALMLNAYVAPGSSTMAIYKYDASTPTNTNHVLVVTVGYEIA